ncbi:MAG: hypothetical protein RR623_08190 [Bacilli bacterium]
MKMSDERKKIFMDVFKENGKFNAYGFSIAKNIYMHSLKEKDMLIVTKGYSKHASNDDSGYMKVCDYIGLKYSLSYEQTSKGVVHVMNIKRDLRKKFFKDMDRILSTPPKVKQSLSNEKRQLYKNQMDCYKEEIIKQLNRGDILMQDITNIYNLNIESSKMLRIRKRYEIKFVDVKQILTSDRFN